MTDHNDRTTNIRTLSEIWELSGNYLRYGICLEFEHWKLGLIWKLEIGIWDLFGNWKLEIGNWD